MVEEKANEKFDGILIEGWDSISREDLQKIYKIKYRGIDFEEYRITPRYYTSVQAN